MKIVQLTPDNLTKEVLSILSQLAPTSKLSLKKARNILAKQINAEHLTFVLTEGVEILAVASIIIIESFLHNGKASALIENVAVRKDLHKNGYGKKLIQYLKRIARKYRCYKVTLNCNESVRGFYEKIGFKFYIIQMREDLIK